MTHEEKVAAVSEVWRKAYRRALGPDAANYVSFFAVIDGREYSVAGWREGAKDTSYTVKWVKV